jgi:hypothetical protein
MSTITAHNTERQPTARPRRVLLIVALLVLAVAGFLAGLGALWYSRYQQNTARALPTALDAMHSDEAVTVGRAPVGGWRAITFTPTEAEPTTGLIFYPGGRVDERAYAPALHALAAEGYFVVLVPMPLDLAILDGDRAAEVIAAHPHIEQWAIAGHSMGAATAANFAHENPSLIDGVVLWAGFPPRDAPLTGYDGPITAITATEDGFVHERRVGWYSDRLPPSAEFISIEGGNHAQFGYYEVEPGGRDGVPTIPIDEQQAQIVEATLALLASLD